MRLTKKDITISNALSLLRLLLAIPFWFLLNDFHSPETKVWLIIVGVIGAFTDWADGFFARQFNQVTELGKIIDPLADKICMAVLIYKLYLIGEIQQSLFFILIGRDVLIFLSGIFLTKYLGKVLPSNFLGKITVTVIAIFVFMIFFEVSKNSAVYVFTSYLIISLSIISLFAYAIRASDFIKKKKNEHI